ncbi:hypothetical protein AbraIFM66951_009538 [Aspergillus brasiliensis]|uniref:Hypervirulence associated protein TUDOR domain-containing protein n=1 Tax=Aspergillus brasiliensis TaxID=319629 RepID=A0A9W5YLF9_9EURO|nr:hypothetical protein AbraCBS73388_002329 [Aspergillus brasiliensis]GKZ41428.1 hypothetical protein AbraIFM66951_009538 [Aspergillus brasiliensis]
MPGYARGDTVRYKPIGGPDSKTAEAIGIIRDVRTHSGTMTGRKIEASDDMPRYEIENSHTHKRAAIKESSILGPAE